MGNLCHRVHCGGNWLKFASIKVNIEWKSRIYHAALAQKNVSYFWTKFYPFMTVVYLSCRPAKVSHAEREASQRKGKWRNCSKFRPVGAEIISRFGLFFVRILLEIELYFRRDFSRLLTLSSLGDFNASNNILPIFRPVFKSGMTHDDNDASGKTSWRWAKKFVNLGVWRFSVCIMMRLDAMIPRTRVRTYVRLTHARGVLVFQRRQSLMWRSVGNRRSSSLFTTMILLKVWHFFSSVSSTAHKKNGEMKKVKFRLDFFECCDPFWPLWTWQQHCDPPTVGLFLGGVTSIFLIRLDWLFRGFPDHTKQL